MLGGEGTAFGVQAFGKGNHWGSIPFMAENKLSSWHPGDLTYAAPRERCGYW